MKPLIHFVHGKESGPWGTKIRHLADIAREMGYDVESLDYSSTFDPETRVEMLVNSCNTRPAQYLVGFQHGRLGRHDSKCPCPGQGTVSSRTGNRYRRIPSVPARMRWKCTRNRARLARQPHSRRKHHPVQYETSLYASSGRRRTQAEKPAAPNRGLHDIVFEKNGKTSGITVSRPVFTIPESFLFSRIPFIGRNGLAVIPLWNRTAGQI